MDRMDATQDICPKGWRLPTNSKMSSITSYASAFSPVYSGYYTNGSLYGTGSSGSWWSATALGGVDTRRQNNLRYDDGNLHTSGDLKDSGDSVRCIRSNSSSSGGDDADNN